MNQEDRQKIDLSCDKIAREVDMNILWTKLLENRIFNFDDCNISSWKENLNSHDTKKQIILSIKTRGPYAFKNFIRSLEQCGYNDLAINLSQLEIDSNIRPQERINPDDNAVSVIDSSDDEGPTRNHYNSFIFENEPLKIVVKKSKTFLDVPVAGKKDLERYIMRSKPRGLVLIVCITKYFFLDSRESATHDRINLQKLFEEMGFEVTLTDESLGRDELRNIIREFSKQKKFRHVDSCFVIFSCHGFEAGKRWDAEVATSDHNPFDPPPPNEKIYCSEIIEFFSSTNCPLLKGKPKVFIFQMCRGDKHQNAVARFATDSGPNVKPSYETEENEDPDQEDTLHRNYEDTLIVHSTVPGYFSYRDIVTGAWFIQILCKVFMKEAYHKHLKDLIDRVDQEVKVLRTAGKMCQTVTTASMGFSKYCFLNPGYFGDGILKRMSLESISSVNTEKCARSSSCTLTKCFCNLPYFLPNEVVIHNTSKDCWVSYMDGVYDLTELCQLWKGTRNIKPILALAGKDISHWFDQEKNDIKHYIHPISGKSVPYCPHGPIPDVTSISAVSSSTSLSSASWRPLNKCPWWLDDKFRIGNLTKNPRPCRIINVLTGCEAIISVCEEDTIRRIQERFSDFNSNGPAYTWTYAGKPVDLDKTLTENGILDERDRFVNCGLPEDIYIPALLCYYNDDLTMT